MGQYVFFSFTEAEVVRQSQQSSFRLSSATVSYHLSRVLSSYILVLWFETSDRPASSSFSRCAPS